MVFDCMIVCVVMSENIGIGKNVNCFVVEKSFYLFQYVYNLVDWYLWGDEVIECVCSENWLIFFLIGYFMCYWCYVMEKELFENEVIVVFFNCYYVVIKVDCEE